MQQARTARDYTLPETTLPFYQASRPPMPADSYLAASTVWLDTKHGGLYFLSKLNDGSDQWRKLPTIPAIFTFRYLWSLIMHSFNRRFTR